MKSLQYTWKRMARTGDILIKYGKEKRKFMVEDWGKGVLRLLFVKGSQERHLPFLEGTGRLVNPVKQDDDRVVFESGGSRFILDGKRGWSWFYKGKLLLREADDYYASFQGNRPVIPPVGISENAMEFSFTLRPEEPVYGGGETFGYLNKRRMKLDLRIMDPCCLTTTGYSYKHVPLFWSPEGWGIFLSTNYPVHADIGATSYIGFHLSVEEPELDIFLIPGTPGEILGHYWRLTGVPPLPPEWALGVWWSRCMYQNAGEVKEVVEGLARHKIKGSVISLDPMWLKNRPRWKYDACDFIWNDKDFGDLEDFSRYLSNHGFKLCLWENPYVWLEGESYGRLKDFLLKDEKGKPQKAEPPLCGKGIVGEMDNLGIWDLRKSEAWEARKQLIGDLVRRGVAAFKADYGEGVPRDDLHNLYAFLYVKNTWEAICEAAGEKEAVIWARPGWSGCQRYPGCWAGDSQTTFPAMAATLAGVLSLAASGVSWWSHDIGGFHSYKGDPPSTELYLRWAEWGLLSPLSRFHGTTPREPWHFGETAVRRIRRLVNLRYRLIPFLVESYHDLTRRGLPMARPLVMDYPDDPTTYDLSSEYLLGKSLLIAPVIEEGAKKRKVYLPEGKWRRSIDNRAGDITGPAWIECQTSPGSPLLFEKT